MYLQCVSSLLMSHCPRQIFLNRQNQCVSFESYQTRCIEFQLEALWPRSSRKALLIVSSRIKKINWICQSWKPKKVGKGKKFSVKIADVALLLKPLSILSTFGGQSLENLLFFEPMQNTWCKKSLDFYILANNLYEYAHTEHSQNQNILLHIHYTYQFSAVE